MNFCFILFLIYFILNLSITIGLFTSDLVRTWIKSIKLRILIYIGILLLGLPIVLAFLIFAYAQAWSIELLTKKQDKKDE